MLENNEKKRTFNPELFDDYLVASGSEQIFYENPIRTFQVDCLENVLFLCGWKKQNLADILNVSISTVNNILANESMTNDKPTYLTRSQFISLLYIIQTIKVKKEKKTLVVFYLFSMLCCGLYTEMNFRKYEQLFSLESSELDKTLFFQVIHNLSPDLFHSFNLFMEWQLKSPHVSMSEYYGGEKNESVQSEWFDKQTKDSEEIAVKKAMENVGRFIPKYLDWYVSQFTKWSML